MNTFESYAENRPRPAIASLMVIRAGRPMTAVEQVKTSVRPSISVLIGAAAPQSLRSLFCDVLAASRAARRYGLPQFNVVDRDTACSAFRARSRCSRRSRRTRTTSLNEVFHELVVLVGREDVLERDHVRRIRDEVERQQRPRPRSLWLTWRTSKEGVQAGVAGLASSPSWHRSSVVRAGSRSQDGARSSTNHAGVEADRGPRPRPAAARTCRRRALAPDELRVRDRDARPDQRARRAGSARGRRPKALTARTAALAARRADRASPSARAWWRARYEDGSAQPRRTGAHEFPPRKM